MSNRGQRPRKEWKSLSISLEGCTPAKMAAGAAAPKAHSILSQHGCAVRGTGHAPLWHRGTVFVFRPPPLPLLSSLFLSSSFFFFFAQYPCPDVYMSLCLLLSSCSPPPFFRPQVFMSLPLLLLSLPLVFLSLPLVFRRLPIVFLSRPLVFLAFP